MHLLGWEMRVEAVYTDGSRTDQNPCLLVRGRLTYSSRNAAIGSRLAARLAGT